jgi:hypothetical protein
VVWEEKGAICYDLDGHRVISKSEWNIESGVLCEKNEKF